MTVTPLGRDLSRLLSPRSIVFIGGSQLEAPLRSCRSIGFSGEIWVVNPHRGAIAGQPCLPSLADLPGVPDAAFIAVSSRATPAVVGQLAAMGAGGAVCYAAGFAERGAAGAQLQQELVAAAGEMPIIGPNCYGMLNYLDGAALWADVHGGEKLERGIAVVSQSGNISLNLTMTERSVPLAQVISVGNQAALNIADFIVPLVDDRRIDAIGLYIEGLADVPAFSRAAAYALAKGVPLVALKVGSSEKAAQLALTHTSSLVGEDRLYDALFQRLGIVRAPSLTAFMESLKLLALHPPLAGGRLGVLTCSGGDAALLADAATHQGLTIPPLDPVQVEALRPWMTDFTTLANPLDYNTAIWGNFEALSACFGIVMAGAVDATALVIDFARPGLADTEGWDIAIDALIAAAAETGKPAYAVASFPELLPEATRRRLIAAGLIPLQGLDEAAFALGASRWYGQKKAALGQRAAAGGLQVAAAAQLAAGDGDEILDEWQSKQALAAHGVAVPLAALVSAADAPQAAERLGFPVVVKAVGAALAHKSEAGAVALSLKTAGEVAAAVARMAPLSARFLVERMVEGAVAEVIVGIKRDPQFGLVLVIGSGGVLVNLVDDSARLLLPLDQVELTTALGRLKLDSLIRGYRGGPPGDRRALLDMVIAIADYAGRERSRLLELDVNPIVVLPEGQGVVAVDALIRFSASAS